jgi:hypothetical protein
MYYGSTVTRRLTVIVISASIKIFSVTKFSNSAPGHCHCCLVKYLLVFSTNLVSTDSESFFAVKRDAIFIFHELLIASYSHL